jgi:O-antigen/teichoic acid export membrane protein
VARKPDESDAARTGLILTTTPSEQSFGAAPIGLERLRARLVRGFGWNIVSTASTQGGTFLINLILANLWGAQLFGQYAIVLSTLTVLTAIAQPGTGAPAVKYVAEHRDRNPARAGRILGLCALVSLTIGAAASGGLIAGAPELAARFLKEPALATALTIAAVAVFFNVMSGFLTGALGGLESYRALGRVGVMTGTLYVSIVASAGWFGGLTGAVAGLAVSACIQAVVLWRVLVGEAGRRGIHLAWREGWREMTVFRRYVAPAVCASLVTFPAVWLGNAFLVQQEQGFRQMALFAAANSFRILVLVAPAILHNVSTSLLNNQLGAAHERRYRKVFWTNLVATAGFVLVASVSISAASPWIVSAFGDEFRAGSAVLLVLMVSTLPETIATALLQVIQSRERGWLWLVTIIVPTYGVLVLLAWLLTPAYGALGLAWGYVAGMSVALVTSVAVVRGIGLWSDEKPNPDAEGLDG